MGTNGTNIIIALISAVTAIIVAIISAVASYYNAKQKTKRGLSQSGQEVGAVANSTSKAIKNFAYLFVRALGPIFIVFAFVLSVLQLIAIQDIANKANTQATVMQSIANSISTRYVDTFPFNMEAINKFIDSTRKELLILSDVPAYGHFSDPIKYGVYINTLESLANPPDPVNKKDVKLLTYDRETRTNSAKRQLIKPNYTLDSLKHEGVYKKYFEHWEKKGRKKQEPRSLLEFLNLLQEEHIEFQNMLCSKMEIFEMSNSLPIFFWLRDNKEAILSFYTYGPKPDEVSFRTSDPRLIDILQKIATVAFQDSTVKRYECPTK